ncbi:ABC transporter ATP-binding protein [Propionibacteriaceae bacterium Y1700]|uniref:ABC transporter ATP-binding protein n=1 Tax=Microlunatus sp. Y1700 TaxID=3418487 RepID=UPI003DA783EC
MTAEVSARTTLSDQNSTNQDDRSGSAVILDQPPRIAPPPTGKRNVGTSLWRLRPYMRPFIHRFAISLVLAIVGVGFAVATPLITRAVIDGPVANTDRPGLWALGLFALTLGIVEAIVMFGRRWVVNVGTVGVETLIRKDLYAKMQRLPMSFHAQWQSGQLLSRIMNDLNVIRRFLGFGITFLIVNVLQIVAVTILLINMYWPLGVVVLISTVPIIALCLNNQKHFTRMSRAIQDQVGNVASTVEEGVQGLRVIKAFGRGQHMYEKFDERSVRLHKVFMDRVRLSSNFWTFLEVIPTFTLIIVLGMGAFAAGTGVITLGTLVAFMTLMLSLVWPIAALGFLLAQAQESMTAADRVAEVLDAEVEITDGPVDLDLDAVRGELRFSDVHFRFPDGTDDVLRGVDLDIRPGETIALVGGTGSGKTLLTSLVPRLQDVTAGAITIDGVDLRDLKVQQLRTIVATAFEDPTLFSMSARENLTLGRPDATEEEIDEAIEVAQAHFVRDLPWGLDTRIGEQGMSLSGGQRQRLALARAVLVQPKILVLDDTLSALDIHTEELVEKALKRVLVGVTGIVVAHRASTVLLADRVAMLHEGRIAHVGTHPHLLETVPEYRELLSAEFNAEAEMEACTDEEVA